MMAQPQQQNHHSVVHLHTGARNSTSVISLNLAQLPSRVQLFSTPWTVAFQAPLSMGFSRQECWSGLPGLPPGDLPDLGIKPSPRLSPALAGGFFTTSTMWEVPNGDI